MGGGILGNLPLAPGAAARAGSGFCCSGFFNGFDRFGSSALRAWGRWRGGQKRVVRRIVEEEQQEGDEESSSDEEEVEVEELTMADLATMSDDAFEQQKASSVHQEYCSKM